MLCDFCGSALEFLGALGALEWFRCRGCGAECNIERETE